MPGVVRAAAISLLAVTGVCGGVSTPFVWTSPVAGSVLSPDDLLNASWTSSQKIISPSFSLCASSSASESSPVDSAGAVQNRRSTTSGGDAESVLEPASPAGDSSDDCGDAVWPNVSLDPISGEHAALLSIPQLSASSSFYLLMKSDLGDTYQSPVFDIDPDPTEAASTTLPTTASGFSSQPTPTQSSPGSTGVPTRKPQPIGPILPPDPPNYVPPPSPSALPPTNTISPAEAAASAATKSRRMLAAAMAVPLSLVAFAALAAAAACLVIRRQKLNNQSNGPTPSFVPSSHYSATGDSFTMFPQRAHGLSKSTIMPEKLASAPASSEYLVQPLHQYQPYFTTSYAPLSGPYHFLQEHHAVVAGRPLSQSEPIPIQSFSNTPVLYPTSHTPLRPHIHCQPSPKGIPITRSTNITPAMFTAPTQSREAAPAAGLVTRPPAVLVPGKQFGTPQDSINTGTANQLTPPATDNTSLHHMTMQNILNSYMAQQADLEYRDSKPMPDIPFEPVDLDAVGEREVK